MLWSVFSEYFEKWAIFFAPEDAQCSETDFIYALDSCAIFSFLDMIDFALKILSKLGTLTTAFSTLCEPDSETLTSDSRKPAG